MRDGSAKGLLDVRKFTFRSRTKIAAPANRVVPPARGGAGDPTLGGASVTVYNSSGSGESFTASMPADGWIALGTSINPKGFKFKSRDPGVAIRRAVIKNDVLKVKAKGSSWGYTLDEPSQGSIAVRFTSGAGPTWCAEALPRPGRDTQDRFVGEKNGPAPTPCPAVP